jgi:hypothetical protein
MKLINELIEIPEHVETGRLVRRFAASVLCPEQLLREGCPPAGEIINASTQNESEIRFPSPAISTDRVA